MEIYTNSSNRTVYIDLPIIPQGGIEVDVLNDQEVVYSPNTVNFDLDTKRLSFSMPFSLTQSDKKYDIHWRFSYTENASTFEYDDYSEVTVATPILPTQEIKEILGEDATDAEVAKVEKAVRFIIQAHTGQFFGKFIGNKSVSGSGETHLRLPMKLIELNKINGNSYLNESLALRGSGWFLQARAYGVPSIKADLDGWHEDPWRYSGKSPIVAPYTKTMFNFIKNAEYVIDGVWGWRSVPAAVQEAAKLLINDYACADALYRDRFLTSMTAADWRIQFHEGAFSNTGNVRANQLLSEFVQRRGWVVI